MNPRVLIIHGWESNSQEHWFSDAKKYYESKGYEVSLPEMPDTYFPLKSQWVDVIKSWSPDERSILIGHSLGGTAILRYLESAVKEIGVCIIIAAPIRSIAKDPIENFFNPEFGWHKIRQMSRKFILLYQTRDPWVPEEHGKELAGNLGVGLYLIEGDDHFDKLDIAGLDSLIYGKS